MSGPPQRAIYEFGPYVLATPQRELRRDGAPVHLQPKVFDVLTYLVSERDRVVTKHELLDRLWPDEAVAESSLTFAIKAIRRALGDDGASQHMLKTFHGRGYRFVAPTTVAGATPIAASDGGRAEGEADSGQVGREAKDGGGAVTAPGLRERIMLQHVRAPLIGREHELALLEAELAEARRGQAKSAFVLGEPGIGKSRLVAEFAEAARTSGAQVLLGRCDEGTPPAFWPWVQVVRSFLEHHGKAETRRLAGGGAADLARLVPGIVDAPEHLAAASETASGEHARLRLFDSLCDFFRDAARPRPLVIILEDLHWADASSLLLLRHLLRESIGSPLLVVGTYRHMEVAHDGALAEVLAWLHRTRRSTRVKLTGLADEELAVLVRALSGREPSADLVGMLGRATDGNPFFVEEYCRDVDERGGFEDAAQTQDELRIPDEIRELLLRRIDRAGAEARAVLALAAVFGRQFRFDDLAASCEQGSDAVREVVGAAEASGLVHAEPERPGVFSFAHATVVEALVGSLPTLERAELHRRAGEALERHPGGDAVQRATELARHFREAAVLGDGARAFGFEMEAGNLLLGRFAHEDASVHYESALRLARAGACDDAARFELLLAMAKATVLASEESKAQGFIREALEIARATGSTTMLARAAIRGSSLYPITPADRVSALEEALAALRAEDDPNVALLARVLAALASSLYVRVGEVERREALVGEAMTLARTSGDLRSVLRVLHSSHLALWRPGHLATRIALAREHVEIAERSGDRAESAAARSWFVPALFESGDIAEGDRQIDRLDLDAGDTRITGYRANAASFRSMRALTRGALEESEVLARQSFELQRRSSEETASMTLWAQIYYVRREQGRLAEIEPGIRALASQVPQLSWDWLQVHLVCEDGRTQEAAGAFERMAEDGFHRTLPPDAHIVASAAIVGAIEVAWRLRHAKAAAVLLERLRSASLQWVVVGLGGVCLGSADYALGLALAASGDETGAVTALERAERAHEAADVELPLLRTRTELALLLAGRRDRASRDRSRKLVAQIRARADALGLAQIARLLDAAGA